MNYAQPRQVDSEADRPDAGKWRWTVRNDNDIWTDVACTVPCPAGDCTGGRAWDDVSQNDQKCETCHGRGRVADDGHDTAEEAAEHYRQWQIENVEWHVIVAAEARQLNRCKMCDKHTASYMTVKGDAYSHNVVCPDHHNRAGAEFLIQLSMGSAYS